MWREHCWVNYCPTPPIFGQKMSCKKGDNHLSNLHEEVDMIFYGNRQSVG